MAKLLKFSVYTIIILIILSACDVIEPPYEENPNNNNTDTTKRKVLIEDFTGYRCGNCPYAAEIGHQLENLYKDKVLTIGVHVGYYAEPELPYEQDYRSETGNDIDALYKISDIGTPNGLINRAVHNNKLVKEKDSWAQFTAQELKKKADMKFIINSDFISSTKSITADIKVTYNTQVTSKNQYLAVYLVETDIVGYQRWYGHEPEHILDYKHHNVLRASMSGTWGEKLSEANIIPGQVFDKHYEFKIPEGSNWNLNNVKVVAFVYADNGGNSKPIQNVDWVNLNYKEEQTDTNPLTIESYSGDTMRIQPLQYRIEWKVALKNPTDKDIDVQVGYNVISRAEGHTISMCAGNCFAPKNENFLAPSTFILQAGTTTTDSYLTIDLTPDDLMKVGETVVDFIYYPKDKPMLVKSKRIYFII